MPWRRAVLHYPQNVLENGMTLLQVNPDVAIMLDPGHKDFGYVFRRTRSVWQRSFKIDSIGLAAAYEQEADQRVYDGTEKVYEPDPEREFMRGLCVVGIVACIGIGLWTKNPWITASGSLFGFAGLLLARAAHLDYKNK